MKNIMKYNILALAFIFFASCNQKSADTKAETEKLMQLSRDWSKAAQTGDIDKILSYWSDDAMVISGNMPVTNGKPAIRQMVEGSLKMPGFKISWEPVSGSVSESGDLGYLVEDSRIEMKDSTGKDMTQTFKTVTVWKKQSDGSWKCIVDSMNPLPGSGQ